MTHARALFDDLGALVLGEGRRLDQLDAAEVRALLETVGVILFRDFGTDLDTFRRFSDRMSRDLVSYAGGATVRSIIGGDPTMMTAREKGHTFPIPLHSEMSYASDRPTLIWFHCERPTTGSGFTTVADGVRFARMLRPETAALFGPGVRYVFRHPPGRWQQIFQTERIDDVREACARQQQAMRVDDDGTVIQECVGPAFAESPLGGGRSFANGVLTQLRWERDGGELRFVRLADGRRVPPEVVAELDDVEASLTREVEWHAGDVLMADNIRVLHGRREITDPSRRVYVRLARAVAG